MIVGAAPGAVTPVQKLSLKAHLIWSLVALISFHAAQIIGVGWLLIPCAYALIELSRADSRRKVFYPMLALGFLFYAPQLGFFWNIFSAAAIALWLVLAFWLALFGLLLYLVRVRFGDGWMLALAPFIWTGLEYFRCELYYLRFGWMTFGMADHNSLDLVEMFGVFGLGFVVIAIVAIVKFMPRIWRKKWGKPLIISAVFFTVCVTVLYNSITWATKRPKNIIAVAGVQLEFPNDQQVLAALNKTRALHTNAQLFMLSEYTFQKPPPQSVYDWCATNQVYLVVGGTEPCGSNFYNMAYVIGTNGNIVHKQVKSVPIQFFKDGLPAPERKLWDSPWGKLGVLTCYDLSYTRVVDDLVQQGAVALLNPTMDVADWGAQQHNLHARVAPIRAAEYGIPIFRVASSGISQIVSRSGRVVASAPYPGEGEMIAGELRLNTHPQLPLDRYLAPFCTAMTGLVILALLVSSFTRRSKAQTT